MKKLIIALAFGFIYCISFGQTIAENEINEHGTRVISTNAVIAYEDDKALGFSLSYQRNGDLENYFMTLLIPKVSKDIRVLKDQLIVFKTLDDKKEIGSAISNTCATYVNGWSIVAVYVISPTTAELLSQQLSKIRFYHTIEGKETFFDIDTSFGKLQKAFNRAYRNINKAIPLPPEKDRSSF